MPIGRSWDIINLSIASVLQVEGNHVMLKAGVLEFTVPGALLIPAAAPGKLAPGTPVLAALGLTGEWGRVSRVSDGSIQVQMVMGKQVVTRTVEPAAVLVLSGKGPGNPVIFHRGESVGFGMLLYMNHERAGVITYTGKLELIQPRDIRFVDVQKIPRKNAAMWAPFADRMEEVKVLDVLENGAALEVFWVLRPKDPQLNPRVISFAKVTRMMW